MLEKLNEDLCFLFLVKNMSILGYEKIFIKFKKVPNSINRLAF